jgi:hypothetical protein
MRFLRRHRSRLSRFLISFLTLTWMTLALQPCATAQEHAPVPMPHGTAIHAGHMDMDHATMDHAGMGHSVAPADPCPPGTDCPVFKAVADQAATKAADPLDLPLQPAPALISSWRIPAFSAPRPAFDARMASAPLPFSPVLTFRVLLI